MNSLGALCLINNIVNDFNQDLSILNSFIENLKLFSDQNVEEIIFTDNGRNIEFKFKDGLNYSEVEFIQIQEILEIRIKICDTKLTSIKSHFQSIENVGNKQVANNLDDININHVFRDKY